MARSIDLALGGTFGLLTDCEEGTWTPEIYEKTGASTEDLVADTEYTLSTARYSKMGKRVSITAGFSSIIPGSRTGDIRIKGLPFVIDTAGSGDGYGAASLFRADFPTQNSIDSEAPVCRANSVQGYVEIFFNVPNEPNPRLAFDLCDGVNNNTGFQFTVEYYTT